MIHTIRYISNALTNEIVHFELTLILHLLLTTTQIRLYLSGRKFRFSYWYAWNFLLPGNQK